MSDGKFKLADVIEQLREELTMAREAGAKHRKAEGAAATVFVVEEATIELQVAITANVEGKAGCSFWFYTAEAKAGLQEQSTQKLIVKLRPRDVTNQPLKVSDDDAPRRNQKSPSGQP